MSKKTVLMSVAVVCGVAFLILNQVGAEAPVKKGKPQLPGAYMVEDYAFYWTAAESGKANVQVDKSDDNPATISLNGGGTMGDSVYMSPTNAVKLGNAFDQTNAHYKKIKGKKEQSKTVTAGDYKVIFFTNKKGAFYVNVRKSKRFSMGSVSLTRKQAAELAQALKDASKLAAYIDAKIKF